ncbi:hypothetical protein QCA50_003166 [Cerrena zonata]|uniref:Uncharacterized protein n=1 Tax=Cerrena zonata TaxID=2478898 RepID=A0AAW0GUC3_9APHY
MEQTSRPRPRVGLPSSPAPRSRSLSARVPSQDIPPRPSSAATQRSRTFTATTSTSAPPVPQLPHQLRPQRSLVNIPLAYNANASARLPEIRRITRVPPPPLPVEKSPVPDDEENLASEFNRKGSVSSLASSASTSSRASATSSSSSLFSSKSPLSATSSTTSLEDEAYVPKRAAPSPSKVAPGFGTALWSRVAVVAENLTVSVSKAIETNIATYSGEATPPGQESRLTRAMKEYHISKAREPSDLPGWLFEEKDRGVIGRLKVMNASPEDNLSRPSSATPSTPPISTNVDRLSTSRPLPSPWENESRQTDLVAPIPRLPQNNTFPLVPRSRPTTPAPRFVTSSTVAQPVPKRVGAPLSMLGAQQPSNARVRFVEQIHPRQSPVDGLGSNRAISERGGSSTAYATQPPAGLAMSRGGSSTPVKGARLGSVDIRGKRPSTRGLPSGVRPSRV